MAKAFGTLSVAATERTGFANVLRLRDDFKKGRCNLRRSPDARGVMEQLIKIEERIIHGYILVGHSLFMAFDKDNVQKRSGTVFLDYVQEGLMAIYEAMYTFNGKNRFSTYVYSCIKHRLISFVRNNDGLIGSAKALHFTRQMSDLKNETLADKTKPLDPDIEMMNDMVKVIPLEPLERILIEGKLRDGRQFIHNLQSLAAGQLEVLEESLSLGKNAYDAHVIRHRLIETIRMNRVKFIGINPITGKPFTRAALSQTYLRGCKKLQVVYNDKAEIAEAA